MAERRFFSGLVHQECLPPSRRSVHRVAANDAATRDASYHHSFFDVISLGSATGFLSVKLEGFDQGFTQRFQQFRFCPLLRVHTRHFFYPADPPLTSLLQDGGKFGVHYLIL